MRPLPPVFVLKDFTVRTVHSLTRVMETTAISVDDVKTEAVSAIADGRGPTARKKTFAGLCVCPSSYGGSHCNVKSCGNNGAYDPINDTCICNPGYAGDLCSECDADGPTEGTLWICVPNGRGSYLLDWISLADAPGTYPGGPTSVDAIYPDSTGYKGGYYDCACRLSSSAISPAVTDYTNQAKKKVDSVLIVAIVLSAVGGIIITIVVIVAVGMFSRMRWRKREKTTSRTRSRPPR